MTLGPEEGHGAEFSGFSFCLRYPTPGAEEVGHPETPTANKNCQQKPTLVAKGPEKGSLAWQNF